MRPLAIIGLVVIAVAVPPRAATASSPVCASHTEGWVELSICLERAAFGRDELVVARLTVRNAGDQEGTLAFFPKQLFNLSVYTPDGRKVYEHSETDFFRFTLLPDRSRILRPTESFSDELTWAQKQSDPPRGLGKYLLEGVLLGRVSGVAKWPIRTPLIEIELR